MRTVTITCNRCGDLLSGPTEELPIIPSYSINESANARVRTRRVDFCRDCHEQFLAFLGDGNPSALAAQS